MNVRQRIADAVGDLVLAVGAFGPLDELWGGLDPRFERAGRDRLEAESPPDTDPERRLPAA